MVTSTTDEALCTFSLSVLVTQLTGSLFIKNVHGCQWEEMLLRQMDEVSAANKCLLSIVHTT